MWLRLASALLLTGSLVGCADGDGKVEEPVATEEPAGIPDSPGAAGEGTAKPAGDVGANDAVQKDQKTAKGKTETLARDTAVEGEMYVNTGALNVRSGPGMSHDVTRTLQRGEKVTVMGQQGVWARIGENEYVAHKFLSPEPPTAN